MCCKDVHPSNTPSSIFVTELGIVILFNEEHLIKAQKPILEAELEIVIFVKDIQFLNATKPILVIELGNTICSNEEQ